MSSTFTYTPSGSAGKSDRTAVSAYMADIMSANVAGHPYGITASGSVTLPVQVSGGFAEAFMDLMLQTVGYQAQSVQQPGADTVSSTSFTDIFSTWTLAVPIAKTYLLHIDATIWAPTLSAGRSIALFQVVVNGVSYTINAGVALIDMISTVNYWTGSWRVPIPLTAGSNTIKLQGKCGGASMSFSTNGNGTLVFTLTG